MTERIFVVDDEVKMAQLVAIALRRSGWQAESFGNAKTALEAFEKTPADVVVTDWKMPGMDGLELMEALRTRQADLPVILMTAFGDVPSAVEAMRRGAFDYVTKPFDNNELRALVARALELGGLKRENAALRTALARDRRLDDIVAESPKMQATLDRVERAAKSNATVLITGESGTGKELVARWVHHRSPRVAGPFVTVNVKAFASGVLESELFGHEAGAFTDAKQRRAGCFERADGGTLFLDEIGDAPLDLQAKLLRVLQEGEVLPVGGDVPKMVDVRVVTATHRDLRLEIQEGRFREDLFFRLNVIPVPLAPLRERPEDILPLVDRFLIRHAEATGRHVRLADATRDAVLKHPWPGNIRELENTIERAHVLVQGDVIEPEDLLLETTLSKVDSPRPDDMIRPLKAVLDQAALEAIEGSLTKHDGRRAEAAEALGIDRTTLYRWMKRLSLDG